MIKPHLAMLLLFGALPSYAIAQNEREKPLEIILPTENRALFSGGGSAFYQYIIRDYEGTRTTPWEGGQYGFVRNPLKVDSRTIYTRFHEGIDIRPIQRDADGEPLDAVRAIDNGQVVYITGSRARSGYGRYVVVEHIWEGCPYYSLYAHLKRIEVRAGDLVSRGDQLGVLGYTGSGIDKQRAHLHFEINLLLNTNFEFWHERHFPKDKNEHGIFNGINLAGFDVAEFYLRRQTDPWLTPSRYLASKKAFFTVRAPASRDGIQLLKRYPWMVKSGGSVGGSWDISFDASGLPLCAHPSTEKVESPVVVWAEASKIQYRYLTRSILEGVGEEARLGGPGMRLLELILQ